jgi:16S rRNA (cytosine967-C5)-methyltransferase
MSAHARRPDPGAATRGTAARVVAQVLQHGVTLDKALATADLGRLGPSDRSQVKALAFGTLRWHHRHRRVLEQLLERPLPRRDRLLEALLSVGLFQLVDERQPGYAAVSATVEAARFLGRHHAAGLVNAALRRFQREGDEVLARAADGEEGRYSHPQWLIDRLRRDWPDDWEVILESSLRPPPLWLRVNRLRADAASYAARVRAETGGTAMTLDGCPDAVCLPAALPVDEIPGFGDGLVTVQDAGSQLAAALLDPQGGMRVLDACAAPGGKATHLLECAGAAIELVALDVAGDRLQRLRDNLERLGLTARVVQGDACRPEDWWDHRPFDRILLDVPCSGTGVIRRHPDIKFLRRDGDITPLAERQLELLEQIWPLLRPGGRLLYATCSVLREENTAVVREFLQRRPDARIDRESLHHLPPWVRQTAEDGIQLLPGPADTDGLYYALMTRQPA